MFHHGGQWLPPEDGKLRHFLDPHRVESFGLIGKRLQFLSFIRRECIRRFEFLANRAHALLLGRGHVVPEDVQALFPAVAEHRLVADADTPAASLAKAILHAVAVD